MNYKHASPLRYPGGKSRISGLLEDLIVLNNLEECVLYELYAGGAGASLNVLFSNLCSKIVLNDLDIRIYAFWYAILNHTEQFIKRLQAVNVDIETWYLHREVYDNADDYDLFELGFSTFFLNRTNRSGILAKAGPIGGFDQTGNYKIDARFNKVGLISRIKFIAQYKERIEISNKESILLLDDIISNNGNSFVFLDPPYYVQGENLYLNFYKDEDHVRLSNLLKQSNSENWLLTYDNVSRIKELYRNFRTCFLPMQYTLQAKKETKEIAVFSNNLSLPSNIRFGKKTNKLEMVTYD